MAEANRDADLDADLDAELDTSKPPNGHLTERVPRAPSAENDIFAIDQSLAPRPVLKTAGTTSLTFDGLLVPPLCLHEDLRDGCGGQLWPAGMVLAKYLLTQGKDSLENKTIVELGAGGGLVGLAVARGCHVTRPIFITDQKPMLALMEKNVALNNVEDKVKVIEYNWGTSTPPAVGGRPDVVLAADCVYFEPAFPLLLQALEDLIGPDTTCYFCFKKRRKADWRFVRDMQKRFEVTHIQYRGRETDQREGIYLYHVVMKSRFNQFVG